MGGPPRRSAYANAAGTVVRRERVVIYLTAGAEVLCHGLCIDCNRTELHSDVEDLD